MNYGIFGVGGALVAAPLFTALMTWRPGAVVNMPILALGVLSLGVGICVIWYATKMSTKEGEHA